MNDMQNTFDWLYEQSLKGNMKGINLFDIVVSEENIMLAYRCIKANTGSNTAGTDGKTIKNFRIENKENFIQEIRKSLENYYPNTVRRVEIPKGNGKTRPLGIPTMRDRLIQQMFKQVLEPICEAKFYKHSYGFRPNRSTKHAIERCCYIAYRMKNHYVVDVDIKSFFENVNHSRLMKQLFNIGIKDRRVLAIISKMLKAPIKGLGIPTKGTPQGGILSPLLSNVVLNDIDWWISNQWETFQTKNHYSCPDSAHRALRTCNLKEMHMVRYADDFKVFTNSYKSATKIFHAINGYLKNQLKLDVSTEKSKITNLRKRRSEFLGFELKVSMKRGKYITKTYVSRRKKEEIKQKLKQRIKAIQKAPNKGSVIKYNTYVLGIRNYYIGATQVNADFADIAYTSLPTLYNRLKSVGKCKIPEKPPPLYRELFKNNFKTYIIDGMPLFPLADIQWVRIRNFNPQVCNYTAVGRKSLHEKLNGNITNVIKRMMDTLNKQDRLEYFDNRISKYSSQRGKCTVTKAFLDIEEIHCHHIKPVTLGGTDKYENLVIVHKDIHKLIHSINYGVIKEVIKQFNLTEKQIEKVNMFRKACNLTEIN